jgi:beta-glucanase (GH16 family)
MVKKVMGVAISAIALLVGRSQAETPKLVEAGAPATLAAAKFLAVPGDQYKLVFNDEFVGAKLDATRWSIGLPWDGAEGSHWHNDQYASYITDEDVAVSDGHLHLTCRKKEIKGKKQNFHYTEGLITTSGKYEFTYGYAEAKCQAPMDAGPGMWPAFWTLSTGWPPEFDIIELWTAEPRIHQGYAYKAADGKVDWLSYHKKGVSMNGYHTYGMEWGPGYIFFSIDGVVNNRIFGEPVTSKAQYLILNSGVGSGKGNAAANDTSIFPNSFDVDYCRVYQREKLLPIVQNAGFEFESPKPWELSKQASVVKKQANTGEFALQLEAGGSAEQKIYGLKPNTSYELSAFAHGERSDAHLAVRDFGAAEVESGQIKGRNLSVDFTTGEESTTAVIICREKSAHGISYFDDVRLTEK